MSTKVSARFVLTALAAVTIGLGALTAVGAPDVDVLNTDAQIQPAP